ncbi:MAG TPA: hypothetical protein VE089_04465 [Nitrososphaeraceae archaeon]|nr:hypothetical protein [Nitrososphaeraceae archaeon]
MKTTSTRRGESESVTFRINSKVLKNLRREAEQKDISTNTLVNKLIKDHLNWHSNAAKAGFISLRRSFVSKVVKYLPEQEIISLAEYVAKTTNKDSILLMKNEYTIKSALDFLESWIKICGYPYKHKVTNNGQNRHSFIIQHDIGMKVSIYLATLFQSLFEELGVNKRIEFDKTEHTLAFTVASND